MEGVTVVDHPLVQHKLTLMRDKETSTAGFRQLLREISLLLTYEVTRDLELETMPIETPMGEMEAPTIKGKKLVFASILRAGNGLLDGMLDLVPAARVAHIGDDTPLFGALPELDSMAVAGVLTEIEDRLHIVIEDDEVDGDMLATFGALTRFAREKVRD